ncbi:MAG: DNA repair protein RecN [Spirochaetes bacterium]|nr:MAG: DNA repair protein RecN [Spirochaetota bacterium]
MLEELTITNYALIESLTVPFTEGLNILSGETGAGKSIIVGALSLILGGKGDPSLIRTGTEEAVVTATIRLPENGGALLYLQEKDIADDDGYIIIRRVLKRSGRGAIYVQSVPMARQDLVDLTSSLFDMHGQHSHQSLLNIEQHRKLLDSYAGITADVEELKTLFTALSSLKKEYEDLKKSEREILVEQDMLRHALREIDAADLKPGEEEDLAQEKKLLLQHENLMELFDGISGQLSSVEGGALLQLRKTREMLGKLSALTKEAEPLSGRLDNAFFEIEDIFETLGAMKEGIDFSPSRLEECEERLQTIRRLEKKYGDSIEQVWEYRQEAERKLHLYESREEEAARLEEKIASSEKKVLGKAAEISKTRKIQSQELENEILSGLKHLGMEKASFLVNVSGKETPSGRQSCGPAGMDVVEFMISPNQGEPVKPLKKIASGGELSRIMLSIKTVLADSDSISTLVFDEIDSGIGGEIGLAVGEYLARLGNSKQILCITHLASIAVRADNHIKVDKVVQGGRTFTGIKVITGEDRVTEIARMLSGDTAGTASIEHARELLKKYS